MTEQRRPQGMLFVLHGHDYAANALQDHKCNVHVGETTETPVRVAKGEVCLLNCSTDVICLFFYVLSKMYILKPVIFLSAACLQTTER